MSSIGERLAAADERPALELASLEHRLHEAGLLREVTGPAAAGSVTRGVTDDSRAVAPGSVFVAISGARHDGHDFVAGAAADGAVAAIVERPVVGDAPPDLAQLVVSNARRALAEAAAWWYGDPSYELGVIGITGTDGKTTTSYLAAAALAAAGLPVGLVGTIATQIGGLREAHAEHATTPSAPVLQRTLRAMADAGDRAVVLETTSHGLALDRVAAIAYDVAIFTNLTSEHLELHGSLEAYRAAKLSLFERLATGSSNPPKPAVDWPRTGIVNVNDEAGADFAEATRRAGARLLTYSANPGRRPADVVATNNVIDGLGRGIRVSYRTPSGEGTIRSPLSGAFNIVNLLAVVALGEALGLDPAAVRAGLESVEAIPGRMELVEAGQPFRVVVDFAHTAASLGTVLGELRRHAGRRPGSGRLIVVFGSAGERDTEKRPDMGRVAGERADVVIVTDEDPRGEDPEAILSEIAAGATAAGKVRGRDLLLIADRRSAIRAALERARLPGDIVLLAGKGHETTIEYAGGDRPWDERAEVLAALAELGFTTAG